MAPIPVHIEDPISPTQGRRQDVQPQTQTQLDPSTTTPAYNPATTTAASTASQASQPARPGAAAVPGPTAAVTRPFPPATRTVALPQDDTPPAPRPGDAPSLANATAFQSNATSAAPPKASNASSQPVTVAPAQAQYSPPEQNLMPTHSTDPTAAARSGPTSLNMGPVLAPAAQHPPGYVQNAYAQELNPAQRASLEVQQQQEKQAEGFAGGLLTGHVRTASSTSGAGAGEAMGETWDAVRSGLDTAGKRASQMYTEAHDAVWSYIKKAT